MRDEVERRDLVLRYLQGKLTSTEQLELFSLLRNCPEFKPIFHEEVRVYQGLKKLKVEPGELYKQRVYQNIQSKVSKEPDALIFKRVILRQIIQGFLPGVYQPITKYI